MGNDARDTFDPRFDPAFQPGFEGPVVTPSAARKNRDVSPAQTALVQRTEQVGRAIAGDSDDSEDEVEVEHRRRPNPFLLALIAVSVALIVGGLGSAQSVRALFDTENISVELDYISLEMIKFAAPLAVALGVATAIGVLFVYALDWKKRHDS